MNFIMGFLTGVGIVVVAGLLFCAGMYIYVELSETYLIRYAKKTFGSTHRCYNCGETNMNRLTVRCKYGKATDEWVCFHNCVIQTGNR